MTRYAQIIINITSEAVDKPFTYRIPDELTDVIKPGIPVMVPFGKGDKERLGYVVRITSEAGFDPSKIKDILGIAQKQTDVNDRSLMLAGWMKENYGSTFMASLKTVMPVKRTVKKRESKSEDGSGSMAPYFGDSAGIVPSESQANIVRDILDNFDKGYPGVSLIHGITGSGKTLCYMELMSGMLEQGFQSILLVPEIALTYQNVARFTARFGDRIAVLHSKLSAGEKSELWERAQKGEVSVVIGPRSALFVPFSKLGLIIIDEEHETSYKSETCPKYHAREVAIQIAKFNNAALVLGSATPSLESYYQAKNGNFRLYTLKERLTGGCLPSVHTVDLRQELKSGNVSMFSEKLSELIRDRLAKKEQIILFLNRRGLSGFISCRVCGKAIKCSHCDVTMSEHMGGRMVCHYCGHTSIRPKLCPECGSKYIGRFKAGTEAVEKAVNMTFPEAKVLRMDADTTKRKGSLEKILKDFSNKKADILVGTQMIVKGHDFPNVTLVGIMAADISLNSSDFRSAERTFQLICQAAGRAGRGTLPGEVVIQTYQPDSYAIVHGANQDYEGFFEEELEYRQLMSYPPVASLVACLIQSRDGKACLACSELLADVAKKCASKHDGTYVIGPKAASISKLSDTYRQVFYIKSMDSQALIQVKDVMEDYMDNSEEYAKFIRNVSVQFDFNPMTGY